MGIIYDGKIIRLRTEMIHFKDGHDSLYEFVEHKSAVAVIPFFKNKIILVKQDRPAIQQVCLEIPAGLIEENECPIVAAKRELEEETGYEAGNLKEITSVFSSPGFTNEKTIFYIATNLNKTKQNLDIDEDIEVFSFSMQELLNKIETQEIKDGKTIIGILLAQKFSPGHNE